MENELDDYTQDGTVDLKGKPVLRSKTGGWRACSLVVGQARIYPAPPGGLVCFDVNLAGH
ncbi:hypothetical protein SADUNF_Sadunf08G0167100 [Salix dunnii]|uniref:Uncharacterized protein n=1 Tax=Salix dunnii TaxID=1413687 RepID=A0A835MT82_9ROSI|nr:hypothetical protein SADUNF_Sadunf08G0167100 [Salix dunnii]